MKRIVLALVIFQIASSYSNPLQSGPNSSGIRTLNGDGVVNQTLNELTKGVEMSQENLNKIREFLTKIDRMIKEVDQKMADVRIKMGSLIAESVTLTKKASDTYSNVKSILRRTRQKLFKLADKTIRVTDDVLLYLEGWGPNYDVKEKKAYFKMQMKLLQDLIDESRTALNDAETKYNDAADKVDEVDGYLTEFLRSIKILSDSESEEHAAMKSRMRAGLYGGGSGVLVGTVIADILGCSGFCSGVFGAVALTGTVQLETKIAELERKLNADLELLETLVSSSDSSLLDMKTGSIGALLEFIKIETGAIQRWQNAIEVLDDKMEYAKDEEFFELSLNKRSFGNAVRNLKAAATVFYKKPRKIFGSDR